MKEIKLTQGKVALVDDEDFEYLNQWKWQAHKCVNTYYAVRNYRENGVSISIKMHREILELKDKRKFGDHKDGNGLNNQRYNLRVASRRENNINRRSSKSSTSKYLGVFIHTERRATLPTRRYRAQINTINGRKHLGYFDYSIEGEKLAALKYNEFAKIYHGEFANLNIV